jgi:hypothetical protein
MKTVLLAVALGLTTLVGCDSDKKAAPAGGAPAPNNSGTDVGTDGKKSPRIPAGPGGPGAPGGPGVPGAPK